MKSERKMTGVAKGLATFGAAVGAGAVLAFGGAGTGRHAEGQGTAPTAGQPAQPTISAPALTSADVLGLRSDIRELQQSISSLNTRLSRLEGIDEAGARGK